MTFCKRHTNIAFFLGLIICFCNSTYAQFRSDARIWASAEYLYWWVQNSPIDVPLATQNPFTFAFINQPDTQIIIGAGSSRNTFHFGGIAGARLTLGGWIDNGHRYGLEASGFGLSHVKTTLSASSAGNNRAIVDVPFFSTQPRKENVLVGNRPNTISDSDTFQPLSMELSGLYNLSNQSVLPLIVSTAIRFFNFNERINLHDSIYQTAILPPFSALNIQDTFTTKNNFYGIQIGALTHLPYNSFDFSSFVKVALGVNAEKLKISGETNVDNKTIIQSIGLFAEPTNIGAFKRNQFAILPEFELKIAYHLNKYINSFITYHFLYVNRVIRPGKEIDRNINLSQNALIGGTGLLSGVAAPTPLFNTTSVWMQGLGAGMELNLY